MVLGGGLLALRFQGRRAFMLAFAAGALIGSALINVIPDALVLLTRSGASFHHHHLMLACTLGFLTFYLLEQNSHDHGDAHGADIEPEGLASPRSQYAGLWGAGGIGVHNVLDGFAIGEAFSAGATVGWIVALAVIVHKFADGVSTIGVLVSTGRGPRVTRTILALTAVAPLVGLAVQVVLPLPLPVVALLLGWFAGVFLYLGAAALIPAAHRASRSRWLPVSTLSGVALVYLLSRVTTV
jgi:ZIP family zinc transporter